MHFKCQSHPKRRKRCRNLLLDNELRQPTRFHPRSSFPGMLKLSHNTQSRLWQIFIIQVPTYLSPFHQLLNFLDNAERSHCAAEQFTYFNRETLTVK